MSARRELLCEVCGREYVVWFAPSDLWNRAIRDHGDEPFLCPTCFTVLAEERGITTTGWLVTTSPEGGPVREVLQVVLIASRGVSAES